MRDNSRMVDYEKKIAAFIKNARQESNLRYADFAKKIGISHTTLMRIENGQQSLTLRTLQIILGRLQISLGDILGEEEVLRKHTRRG